jgi:hypothetical protein
MIVGPTLRAALRRGEVFAAALFLVGVSGVIQPTLELVAPSKAQLGDTVRIALRVRNPDPKPLQLELSGRPVGFDVVIDRADGTPVWSRMGTDVAGAALMLLTLGAGETRDFTVSWGQVDAGGKPVAPGRYNLWGILPTGAGRMTTLPRELLIEP